MWEGVMHAGEWILLLISVGTAAYLALAMWRPEKF
jgi:K+-transporting ATPase KdpF subunit